MGPQPEIFSVREMVLKNQTGAIKKKIEGGVKSTFMPWRKSEICVTIFVEELTSKLEFPHSVGNGERAKTIAPPSVTAKKEDLQ